jgi:uncharacterized radical SAM superfamily protein
MNLEAIKKLLEVDIRKDMIEELYAEDLGRLQSMAAKMRNHYFGKKITFYTKPFEPVSVTGSGCDLSCKHCNKHYLGHMQKPADKKSLAKLLASLKNSGINGVVLSGGSRMDGSVPTYEFSKAIKKAKKETGLVMNAHTGLVNSEQAKKLSGFLDAALTDVIGDEGTIKGILGLNKGPGDYEKTLLNLRAAGIKNLSPHIIVGLHHGEIKGELNALSMLAESDPDNIVIVVFIPTKGTEMENDKPPKIEEVAKIISIARIMYPAKNISLSCVRPGGRYRTLLDAEAVKSGINKIAVPSKAAYKAAEECGLDIEVIKESRCCSW